MPAVSTPKHITMECCGQNAAVILVHSVIAVDVFGSKIREVAYGHVIVLACCLCVSWNEIGW